VSFFGLQRIAGLVDGRERQRRDGDLGGAIVADSADDKQIGVALVVVALVDLDVFQGETFVGLWDQGVAPSGAFGRLAVDNAIPVLDIYPILD